MSTIFINSFLQALWTPAIPTTGGGVSPHTWLVPGIANFQDTAKTTPAGVGDVVGAAVNQGSNTYDVVQATADNKPTLQQVTIGSVTSYVWRYDGTNDFLAGTFGGGALSQPHTVFAAARLAAVAVNDGSLRYITDSDNTGGQRLIVGKNSASTPDDFWMYEGTTLLYGAADSNNNIFTALFNGASSSMWKNGGTAVTGNAGTQAPLGISVGGFGGGRWIGDIYQVLIYPGNLSTADKNQVGEYLERVTGIVWTTIV